MSRISADIATNVEITARVGDSFYLKIELENESGGVYDLSSIFSGSYTAEMKIIDVNDTNVLTLTSEESGLAARTVYGAIEISASTFTIDVASSDMVVRRGSYRYKLLVKDNLDKVTFLVGKFKAIDS
jgi:hypothetical protein